MRLVWEMCEMFIFWFGLSIPLVLFCETPAEDQLAPKKQITIVAREIIKKLQAIGASKIPDKLDRLDNETFKQEFVQLHRRAQLYYLISMDIDRYEQFLKRFDGESEWNAFCKKLTSEDRLCLPSWTRQIKIIRDCYYAYYLETHIWSWFAESKKEEPTQDLTRWKRHYCTTAKSWLTFSPLDKEFFMNLRFQRKKLKLLEPCLFRP